MNTPDPALSASLTALEAEIALALAPIFKRAGDANLAVGAMALVLGRCVGIAWHAAGRKGPVSDQMAHAQELASCGLHLHLARTPGGMVEGGSA